MTRRTPRPKLEEGVCYLRLGIFDLVRFIENDPDLARLLKKRKAPFFGLQHLVVCESLHRETYRVLWRWSDRAVDHAMLTGGLHTVFGWQVRVPAIPNERS